MDAGVLVSRPETKLYDFATIEEAELFDITIPLAFQISASAVLADSRSAHRTKHRFASTISPRDLADMVAWQRHGRGI